MEKLKKSNRALSGQISSAMGLPGTLDSEGQQLAERLALMVCCARRALQTSTPPALL